MIWLQVIAGVLIFAVGLGVGYIIRDVYDILDDLIKDMGMDKPVMTGPTLGSYNTPKDPMIRKPTVHVITPKSPERMEWERQNRKPEIMGPEE